MVIFKKIYLLVILVLSTVNAFAILTVNGDYKLEVNGRAEGIPHADVERAGVVLVKDFGEDEPNKPGSRYAIILGHDGNWDFWNFQAGKCEKWHKFTSKTASEELKEETAGAILLTSQEIAKQPYIYSAQKQLFFVRKDDADVNKIKKACIDARNDPTLPKSWREIDDIDTISVSDLIQAASTINNQNLHQKQYDVPSRTTGKIIKIDGFYMRMIANKLPETIKILNNLFPDAHFID